MSEQLEQLKKLYEDYIQQARLITSQAPYGAGLFSSHADPKNHPCHTSFYEAAGKQIAQFAAQPDGSAEDILLWILQEPESCKGEPAYWYLIAALNHAKLMIPLLTAAERSRVHTWYSQFIPQNRRYPVQDEILKLLLK